jgi:hypothetical protein
MTRKFVKGQDQSVVIKATQETVSAACQGCGSPVTIRTPNAGDILCAECMKSKSYSLEYEGCGDC